MKLIVMFLSFLLAGCAMFEDISPENRHKYWVASLQAEIGKSIFNCDGHRRCKQVFYKGEKLLENGNKEAEFFMPHRKGPRCHYYFEYEISSGMIVGYRYDEIEPFSCADVW